jgi:excisionase family DNA binding protein
MKSRTLREQKERSRMINNAEILTVREASVLLKVHERTLKTWINEGRLPAFRVKRAWRVRRSDMLALFRAHGATRGGVAVAELIEDTGTRRPVRQDDAREA